MTVANSVKDNSYAKASPLNRSLGERPGSLKIAPGAGMSKMDVNHRQYVIFGLIIVAVAASTYGAILYMPEMSRGMLKLIGVAIFAIIACIVQAICSFRLSKAKDIEVYENGFRLTDPSDYVNGQGDILWSQVDTHANHAKVKQAGGFGDNKRLTLCFRLSEFAVTQKSHELDLIVKEDEHELAEYLTKWLGCPIMETV